jgi:hypothetical protein
MCLLDCWYAGDHGRRLASRHCLTDNTLLVWRNDLTNSGVGLVQLMRYVRDFFIVLVLLFMLGMLEIQI